MEIDNSKRSLTISNSPIEFAVIGPKGKRNGVLVRSKNLQVDLIGFAVTGREMRRSESVLLSSNFLFSYISSSRTINYVESRALDHVGNDWDKRKSEYRLYWVGLCSISSQREIRETFNRYMTDLLSGIEEEDLEQVEWSLASTILSCLDAQMLIRRRRQTYLSIMAIYILPILVATSVYLFRIFLR